MPDADNLSQSSPPAATVWPPPPASAPETLTVEDVTVTVHGEQLYVHTSEPPVKARLTIGLAAFMWAVATSLQFYTRYYSNLSTPFWHDKNFLLKIWEITGVVVCGAPLIRWQEQWEAKRKKDKSTFMFHQGTKQITSLERFGGGTGVVTSLVICRYSRSGWNAIQFCLERPTRSLFEKRSIAHFRGLQNAKRAAQEIGEFLDVPVEIRSA